MEKNDVVTLFEKKVYASLRKIEQDNQISFKGSTIVVAVSTGVDSSTLLHLLQIIKDEWQIKIVIAHVNHGKRKQSDIEENYIRTYALNNQIDIEVLKLSDQDFSGVNFQEEARNKRILFFKQVLAQYQTKYLFLAHHLNDDIETMLMHLMRNASIEACVGLKPCYFEKEVYFIRPLLDCTKEEIYDYAKKEQIKYFEDYTNDTDHYTRNKVRHHLVKDSFLENNLINAYQAYKNELFEASKRIQEDRDNWLRKHTINEASKKRLRLDDFFDLEVSLQKDILFELLKEYNFSMSNILELLKILKTKGNKKIRYKNILILKEYNLVAFCLMDSKNFEKNKIEYTKEEKYDNMLSDKNEMNPFIINSTGKTQLDELHYIAIEKVNKAIVNECFLEKSNLLNKDVIWYNLSMMPFVLRSINDGDRIAIKGGSKLVRDILKELKMPLHLRERIKVLVDKDNHILSILGIRKSYLLNQLDQDKINIRIETNYYQNI